ARGQRAPVLARRRRGARRAGRMGVLSLGLRAGQLRPGGRAALALPGQLCGGPRARRPRAGGTLDPRPAGAPPAGRPAAAGVSRRRLRGGTALSQVPDSPGLYQRACAIIPGGVNSPVRAFGAVGGEPVFIASGSGPYLTDTGGKQYVDLVCSWGPMILGHAHPAVVAAVTPAAGPGTSFRAPTPAPVEPSP